VKTAFLVHGLQKPMSRADKCQRPSRDRLRFMFFSDGVLVMKFPRCLCSGLVALATIGVAFPQIAVAADRADTGSATQVKLQTRDIVLGKDGKLCGQVVNQQGIPQLAMPVILSQGGQIIAVAQTDESGEFELAQVRGGIYQLHTAGGVGNYRLWANGTAPPSAVGQALLVHDEAVALGQFGNGKVMGFLTNPWVVAGIVATAVAVPVAIHNSDDDSGS